MKFLKNNKGNIAIWLTLFGSVAVALIGGWFSQSNRTDAAIDTEKNERKADNLAMVEQVAIVKTKVDNLQKDSGEMKGDIKELLKRVK